MSFDIKYDRNGQIIPDRNLEKQLTEAKEKAYQEMVSPIEEIKETTPLEAVEDLLQEEIIEDTLDVEENNHAATSTKAKKTPDQSFRELKAAKEKAERERDELFKKYIDHIESKDQRSAKTIKEDPIPDEYKDEVNADDLVEGKHLSKTNKQIRELTKQVAEQRKYIEEQNQQRAMSDIENRLKSRYSDFDKVVSEGNIELLRKDHPELAATISADPNLESKAISAYKIIRSMGIYKDAQDQPDYEDNKRRIEENSKKPRLSPSFSASQKSESPLTKAHAYTQELTPELMKQYQKEMADLRRRY